MSVPSLPPQGTPPKRLAFLTVPLLISLFYNAISLLTLPFSASFLNDVMTQMEGRVGVHPDPLSPGQVSAVLWISFALTAALILWLYFTRRAVLEGRRWGRVSSIVIGVFSLLLFPLGTVLGLVMLVGAFDREVTAYVNR